MHEFHDGLPNFDELMAVALDAGEAAGVALPEGAPLLWRSAVEPFEWNETRASGHIALLPHGVSVGLLDDDGLEWFIDARAVARVRGPHGPWREASEVR